MPRGSRRSSGDHADLPIAPGISQIPREITQIPHALLRSRRSQAGSRRSSGDHTDLQARRITRIPRARSRRSRAPEITQIPGRIPQILRQIRITQILCEIPQIPLNAQISQIRSSGARTARAVYICTYIYIYGYVFFINIYININIYYIYTAQTRATPACRDRLRCRRARPPLSHIYDGFADIHNSQIFLYTSSYITHINIYIYIL